jgi:hypothetical protein
VISERTAWLGTQRQEDGRSKRGELPIGKRRGSLSGAGNLQADDSSPQTVLDYLGRSPTAARSPMTASSTCKTAWFTLSYRDRKEGDRKKALPHEAHEFIRRFLLHVLPEGFMRIRHFGLLANRSKKQALTQCRKLLRANPTSLQSPTDSAKDLLLRITGISISVAARAAITEP